MRSILVLAVIGVMALTATPHAFGQPEPTLTMVSASVEWGRTAGVIAGPCKVFNHVTSPGFVTPIALTERFGEPDHWRGFGSVVQQEGTYVATMHCDRKTLTASFTVLPPEPPRWGLYPLEVEPGGEVNVGYNMGGCQGGALGPVTSPGFAAPIPFTGGGNFDRRTGKGNAGSVPGTYTATLRCRLTPIPGEIMFRILGTPPVQPSPAQPSPSKSPIIKPKGAPQTGSGGTAG